MRKTLTSLVACVVLAMAAVPGTAFAASDSTTAHYTTSMTALTGSSPYTGTLDLTIEASGIVNGYYFPSDYSALYVPVVGGKTGDSIWLEIGSDTVVHVQAQLLDGVIRGTAYTGTNDPFAFVAQPAAAVR